MTWGPGLALPLNRNNSHRDGSKGIAEADEDSDSVETDPTGRYRRV